MSENEADQVTRLLRWSGVDAVKDGNYGVRVRVDDRWVLLEVVGGILPMRKAVG